MMIEDGGLVVRPRARPRASDISVTDRGGQSVTVNLAAIGLYFMICSSAIFPFQNLPFSVS